MSKHLPLVDAHYLLQKFPGKGGWTYAAIPEIVQNKNNPFGWVQVKGSIDGFELKQHKLMPMGNGKLFLSVKASIRKKIDKQQGDTVHIILYSDDSKIQIPQEIQDCFALEPQRVYSKFREFPDGAQKAYLDWIYEAKSEETKTKRIVEMIRKVSKGLKLHDSESIKA